MLNRIFYLVSAFSLLLLLAGCKSDDLYDNDIEVTGMVRLSFGVFPKVEDGFRASHENDVSEIKNVELWIYDENGLFIGRYTTKKVSSTKATDNFIYQFQTDVPVSSKPRTIHLIANYILTSDKAESWKGLSEAQTIGGLFLTKNDLENGMPMWGVQAVDNLLTNKIIDNSQAIPVYLAASKVDFNILAKANLNGLSNFKYTLCNALSRGTIAPFEDTDQGLKIGGSKLTEIPGEYIVATEQNMVPAGTPIYTFEQSNNHHESNTHPYLIVSALLNGERRYYKLALVNPSADNYKRYDLRRGKGLSINLNDVKNPIQGKKSFEEAKNAVPSNNILLSADLNESNYVAEGHGDAMMVWRSYIVVPQNVTSISFPVHYYPNAKNLTNYDDGSGFDIKILGGEDNKLIQSATWSFTNNQSLVNVTFKGLNGKTVANQVASIIITSERNRDLKRVVTFESVPEYPSNSIQVSHDIQGNGIKVTVNFPANFSEKIFPLEFRMITNDYYPDPNDHYKALTRFLNLYNKTTTSYETVLAYSYVLDTMPLDRTITFHLLPNKSNPSNNIQIGTLPYDIFGGYDQGVARNYEVQ